MKSSKKAEDLTVEELQNLLKGRNTITYTVAGIFAVIILGWVVTGYWRQNMLLFISTIVLAMGVSAAMHTASYSLRSEIKKRKSQRQKLN
jgi:hypothetical protein